MRREGRQHGMVRTYDIMRCPWNDRPPSRVANQLDPPPPTAGFTRVNPKPTNHSKFTGRCGIPGCSNCHLHPRCKSRDKVRGSHKKLRSNDVVCNFRLVSCGVMDRGRPCLNLTGFSATGILNNLSSDYSDDEVDDSVDDGHGKGDLTSFDTSSRGTDTVAEIEIREIGGDGEDNEDDDQMSFC